MVVHAQYNSLQMLFLYFSYKWMKKLLMKYMEIYINIFYNSLRKETK